MVIPAGVEPTACCLGGSRSILLSYETKSLETVDFTVFVNFFAVMISYPFLLKLR